MLSTKDIGTGTPLTGRPSHTTVHTGPYTAIRLIKAGLRSREKQDRGI